MHGRRHLGKVCRCGCDNVPRMKTIPAARMAAVILSCSLFAACGGGGGGGTVATAPVPTASPGPISTPSAGASRSVVRSDAETILTAGKLLGDDGYFVGGPPLGAMSVVRHVASRRRTQAVQCSSGGSSGVGSVSFSESTDAQGNTTQTYDDYYDASCQQIERMATLVYPPGASLGSSGSITGTTTEYDKSAAVTGYATVQSSWTPTSVTAQTADAKTVGGAVVGRSGVTCTASSTTSTTQTCGTASFATVGGATNGLVASLVETFTSTGQTTGTVSAQMTATTYAGSALALVPPSSGTAWGLSGGTQLDLLTGSGNATFNGSLVIAASYVVGDTTTGINASGAYSGSGTLTIALTQTGSTLATITIDVDGNGTITFADGTKETVAGFVIFG